jgi:Rrf2 family protein
MYISTRGRYALRALLDVALHAEGGPVSRSEIAARQQISAEYIAQLFRSLAAAGLVRGVKGPGGGYVLAREAAEIRVGDVVRAVEGPIATVNCILPNSRPRCDRLDSCVTRQLWVELSNTIADYLDSITILDLCHKARQMTEPLVPAHADA